MERMNAAEYNATRHEEDEQADIAALLDRLGILWTHVPNEGKRHIATAMKLKRQGVKAGFPDVCIFDRPPKYPEAPGSVIEMKRVKGGTVSDEQKHWLEQLKARGWKTGVAHGANEAERLLREWGYMK